MRAFPGLNHENIGTVTLRQAKALVSFIEREHEATQNADRP